MTFARFTRLFRLSVILLSAIPVWWSLTAQAGPIRQVISLNLCTDQLLMALADPDQIAGLSPLSRDPLLSAMPEQAKAFRMVNPRSETLLQLTPDLVLAAPYEHRLIRQSLARHGIEVMALGVWTGLDDGKQQIRALAERLGHSGRGQALIDRIDAALEQGKAAAGAGRSLLEIERRLYAPGARSLVADIVARWGWVNKAEAMGVAQGSFVSLERLLGNRPDVLVITDSSPKAEDQGTALLHHRALDRAFDETRRIGVPTRLALCGGPQTPDLIAHLAQRLAQTGR